MPFMGEYSPTGQSEQTSASVALPDVPAGHGSQPEAVP